MDRSILLLFWSAGQSSSESVLSAAAFRVCEYVVHFEDIEVREAYQAAVAESLGKFWQQTLPSADGQ